MTAEADKLSSPLTPKAASPEQRTPGLDETVRIIRAHVEGDPRSKDPAFVAAVESQNKWVKRYSRANLESVLHDFHMRPLDKGIDYLYAVALEYERRLKEHP